MDEEIKKAEAHVKVVTDEANAHVKALKQARELLAEEVLNRPTEPTLTTPTSSTPASPDQVDSAVKKVGLFLLASGPKRSDSIKRECQLSDAVFMQIMATQYFEKEGMVYKLTTLGHTKFKTK